MWRQQIIKQIGKKKAKQALIIIIIITIPLAGFTAWLSWLHQVFPLLWPTQVTQILPYISYVSTLPSFSSAADTLISHFHLLPSLSLCFLPHPCISSPSASICFVSSSGTLYTPVSLLTPLFLFPILALSSLFNLDSALSLLQPLLSPSPISPPLCSLNMDKFFPVFSLTKRPSVGDTACLGNHRAPVTLSHPSMSRTNVHTGTRKLHAHAQTLKQNSVCVCLLARKCVIWFVFSMSEFRCASLFYLFACASSKFTFQPSCMHMYHLLFSSEPRHVCTREFVCVWHSVHCFHHKRCKKMRRSLYPAVGAVPTCCNCGLCKHSTLITIRELSLNSLAPWLVWRAKICIQSKALECIRVILLRRALRREQCLSKNRALSV